VIDYFNHDVMILTQFISLFLLQPVSIYEMLEAVPEFPMLLLRGVGLEDGDAAYSLLSDPCATANSALDTIGDGVINFMRCGMRDAQANDDQTALVNAFSKVCYFPEILEMCGDMDSEGSYESLDYNRESRHREHEVHHRESHHREHHHSTRRQEALRRRQIIEREEAYARRRAEEKYYQQTQERKERHRRQEALRRRKLQQQREKECLRKEQEEEYLRRDWELVR